jgi:hypothetical protein
VVKFLGLYMFEEMSDKEYDECFDKSVHINEDIHDEVQLAEHMAKLQAVREPLGGLQWRVTLIPNYNETESIFVFKVHHSLGDGLATVFVFFNLTDKPDIKEFPQLLMRFTLIQNIVITLCLPFITLYYSYFMLTLKDVQNPFTDKKVQDSVWCEKRFAISKDISVQDIKQVSTKLSKEGTKITLNDVLLTATSKTFKSVCDKKGFPQVEDITLFCPFSLRKPPVHVMDFNYDNDFSIIPLYMRLVDDLKEGIQKISKDMRDLKKSLMPIGCYYSTTLTMQLPDFIRHYILADITSKISAGFSNVPGPKTPWVVNGRKCKSLAFIMPVGKNCPASLSIFSQGDIIKVGILIDKSLQTDP